MVNLNKYFKGDIMVYDSMEIINALISNISEISEVQAIGISGGKTSLPKVGEGDIDIFIYCDKIPSFENRQAVINQLGEQIQEGKINVFENEHWESVTSSL
jgi:predicted nucleotidyltransferase